MADDAVSASTTPATAEPGATSPAVPAAGDWRAALPPELVADKSLERYKDVGSLAKAYLEAERRIGTPLQPPGADATPEQLAAYRHRLGVPDTYDAKDLPTPVEGSGFAWDPQWVGRMDAAFQKAHFTPAQRRAAADLFHEYMHTMADGSKAQAARADQEERAQAVKVLEQAWGPYGGAQWRYHEARARTAINTVMADAPEEDRDEVYQLANHPAFARALSRMADGLLERGFVDGQELPGGTSASEAHARIEAMRAEALKDPAHPLMNRAHPDHDRVTAQYLEYQRIEAGDGARYRRFANR